MLDEVDQCAVVERSLTDSPIEVNAFQNILKRIRIGILHRRQSLVQPGIDAGLQMSQSLVAAFVVVLIPASVIGDVEVVLVRVGKLLFDEVRFQLLCGVFIPHPSLIFLKLIVQAFEEQDAEDEFFVFRGIHVASQNIARFKQLAFELRQRQLFGLLLCCGKR